MVEDALRTTRRYVRCDYQSEFPHYHMKGLRMRTGSENMFVQRSAIAMALAASCTLFAGCSSDSILNTDKASVRLANAMTGGSGSLGLGVNGGVQGAPVAYQSYGSCQKLSPNVTTFTVGAAGTSTALVSSSATTLSEGTRYTVLASGSATTPNLTVLTDDYTTPSSGRARLRVVNAVGVGALFDTYVGAPSAALGTASQTSVAFNSSPAFLDVPSGATEVNVTVPGTQTVLGTSAAFTLNSGDIRTLVITPSATVGGTYSSFLVPEC